MEAFSVLLALCAENWMVTGEFPSSRQVPRSFGVFFDVRLNKRLSKQSRRRWFGTQSRSLWRHCIAIYALYFISYNFVFPIARWCSRQSIPRSQNTCIILRRYCMHIFYRCHRFYDGCFLCYYCRDLVVNDTCWLLPMLNKIYIMLSYSTE